MLTNIVIADYLPIFIEGLKSLLHGEPNYEVVGTASNTKELIDCCKRQNPDIVIIDYTPEYFDSDELISYFKRNKQIRLIVFSSDEKKWNILKSLELNVFSYLTKDCSQQDLLRAIRVTQQGEKYFCDFVLSVLLEKNNSVKKINLSEREAEITSHIAQGKTNKEIALLLNLSPHTVHSHRKNIFKKTGTKSAIELSEYARVNGII